MQKNVLVVFSVTITLWLLEVDAGPPFTITIDCGPTADQPLLRSKLGSPLRGADSNSLCDCIQKAFPKGVKDGKFIMRDSATDQLGNGDMKFSISELPPKGFKSPRRLLGTPSLAGTPDEDTEDSAERLERLQKGVQKMMHVVKVMEQLDHYFSDRTRIVVDKLSKLYLE